MSSKNSKIETYFVCQNCGYKSLKWLGRCPECGEWNTFVEEKIDNILTSKKSKKDKKSVDIVSLKESINTYNSNYSRIFSGIDEWDKLLGGGLVKGALNLIGGEPGIGKSTLMLQISQRYASKGHKVYYISGEESLTQILDRAKRLGVNNGNIYILTETDIDIILEKLRDLEIDILILDSIQTLYTNDLTSAPGTVSQIKEVAFRVMNYSKKYNVATFLIGHITKTGDIAGPKILEHLVDGVFYFEGDRFYDYRILRCFKNRFGSTSEIAVFEMTEKGLVEVNNAEDIFLNNKDKIVPGISIVPIVEGSRVIFIEIQALVTLSNYGQAQRVSLGIDHRKLSILIAIIEKYLNIEMGRYDVFVNISGGLRIEDPYIDLGIIIAILSSLGNYNFSKNFVAIGEVTLAGFVRSPSDLLKRVNQAKRLGYNKIIVGDIKEQIEKGSLIVVDEIRYIKSLLKTL